MSSDQELTAHRFADFFSLNIDAIDDLAERIQMFGQRDPIVLLDGQILDGRRRYRACRKIGVKPYTRPFNPAAPPSGDGDPLEFVLDKNIHHRQDDYDARAEVCRLCLAEHPEWSDHRHATACRISHPSVAGLRQQLVEDGTIPAVERRIDTKGRIVPASQPPRPKTETAKANDRQESRSQPVEASSGGEAKTNPVTVDFGETKPTGRARTASPPPIDADGVPVPSALADVFADTFYNDAISAVERMRSHVRNNSHLYKRMVVQDGFFNITEALIQNLSGNAPHSVCLKCLGSGKLDGRTGCNQCYTQGWISASQHGQYLDLDAPA